MFAEASKILKIHPVTIVCIALFPVAAHAHSGGAEVYLLFAWYFLIAIVGLIKLFRSPRTLGNKFLLIGLTITVSAILIFIGIALGSTVRLNETFLMLLLAAAPIIGSVLSSKILKNKHNQALKEDAKNKSSAF